MSGPTEDQIIAQELAKLQRGNVMAEVEVNESDVYKELTADFPTEALSKDSSRGFNLTSVKAQYVIERLNEVFGFMNWTFGGEYKDVEGGVLFMGTLIVTVNGRQNRHFAPGFAATGPKKILGDVYKSAHTDSLSKCASKFGVANSVFKGLVDANSIGKVASSTARTRKKTNTTEETNTEVADAGPTNFQTRRSRRAAKSL